MALARSRFLLLIVAAPSLLMSPARADGVWTLETVSSGLSPNVSIALDESGAPAVAFNQSAQPAFARRTASGWQVDHLMTPGTAATAGGTGDEINGTGLINYVTVWLAFDPVSGEPRIAYAKSPYNDVWYAQHSPSGWTYELISGFGDVPSLVIDPAGYPRIVYSDYGAGATYAVRSHLGWDREPIGIAGASSLRLDSSGVPHVTVTTGNPNSDLLHAERGDGGWSSETCDTTGNTGFSPSLALDADGEPHIAYLDFTSHQLRYAVRSGGVWTTETVATPSSDGWYCSLALAPDGEPFIAYFDPDAADLRFARRENGQWTSEVVESAGNVGKFCSLALDAEGRPHIGYYDHSNLRIRYATGPVVATGVGPVPSMHGWGIARLAPNPARAGEPLDIALRMAGGRSMTLELLDAGGRRVAERTATLGDGLQTLRWDPAVSRAGLYFLRARLGTGESAVARLAILR